MLKMPCIVETALGILTYWYCLEDFFTQDSLLYSDLWHCQLHLSGLCHVGSELNHFKTMFSPRVHYGKMFFFCSNDLTKQDLWGFRAHCKWFRAIYWQQKWREKNLLITTLPWFSINWICLWNRRNSSNPEIWRTQTRQYHNACHSW